MDRFQFLVITIIASYIIFEFYSHFGKFFAAQYRKYKCKFGFHKSDKNRYYCEECKKPSKGHLKVINGEGEFKKKVGDFKF